MKPEASRREPVDSAASASYNTTTHVRACLRAGEDTADRALGTQPRGKPQPFAGRNIADDRRLTKPANGSYKWSHDSTIPGNRTGRNTGRPHYRNPPPRTRPRPARARRPRQRPRPSDDQHDA